MLSGPNSIPGFPSLPEGFTTLPPPSAIERKSGSEISTGMPKKSEGLRVIGRPFFKTLIFAVVPPMSIATTSFRL